MPSLEARTTEREREMTDTRSCAARPRFNTAPTPPKGKGFTLLEVVVAMTVLALGLAAALKAASQRATHVQHLRDQTFAHYVALNKIAELQLSTEWPALGSEEGADQLAGQDWQWITIVRTTPDEAMRRVEVEVRYPGPSDAPLLSRTAYLRRPQ